jgi:prepilin-type N-terminal cleavage/methylation domain-containing protein
MQRRSAGFTLLELMVVLGIVAVMVAIALPGFTRYSATESAKSRAQRVAAALREARMRALKDGIPYLVILNPTATVIDPPLPDQSSQLTLARIVRDSDNVPGESKDDTLAINVNVDVDSTGVRAYTPGTDTRDDAEEPEMNPAGGALSRLQQGSSFPDGPDPTSIAAFNARGMPYQYDDRNSVATGTGGYYVSDGNHAVYGAVMGPLGEVRILALDGGGEWR